MTDEEQRKADDAERIKYDCFVEEYLKDFNGTRAAIAVGSAPVSASMAATRMLRHPYIAREIARAKAARLERCRVDGDNVLRQLSHLIFLDPRRMFNSDGTPVPLHELPEEVAAAITAIEVQELTTGQGDDQQVIGHVKRYRFADKMAAINSAMKHLQMFPSTLTVTGPGGGPVQVDVKADASKELHNAVKSLLEERLHGFLR
jgi:phage terminase small subunit